MSRAQYRVVTLDTTYDRDGFSSESEPLDRYFKQQVTQDVRRRVTTCFVALTYEQQVAGYYTLASSSVLLADLPDSTVKKLPRYPSIPAVRMGRLAVDKDFKGHGLGGAMLADALERASRSEIAAYALVVDAKDETASSFYRHHGFLSLPNSPLTLFLPLSTVRKVSRD